MGIIKSLSKVDTHLHLWDLQELNYPWLEHFHTIKNTYLIDDYQRATQGFNIEKMVFVQCECDESRYLDEVLWVKKIAMQDPRIKGIVSFFPLEKSISHEEDLEWLANEKIVKGIRRQYGHNPALCLQSEFLQGLKTLSAKGLSFDICIKQWQLKETIAMVDKCPEVNYILDHCGKPDIANKTLEPWKTYIKALAENSTVSCKISGLITEANWQHWSAKDLRPYLDYVLQQFGFDRVMFGGDWPVVLLAGRYEQWMDVLAQFLENEKKENLVKLFQTNAERIYRV